MIACPGMSRAPAIWENRLVQSRPLRVCDQSALRNDVDNGHRCGVTAQSPISLLTWASLNSPVVAFPGALALLPRRNITLVSFKEQWIPIYVRPAGFSNQAVPVSHRARRPPSWPRPLMVPIGRGIFASVTNWGICWLSKNFFTSGSARFFI
jgi:hypothetical protein